MRASTPTVLNRWRQAWLGCTLSSIPVCRSNSASRFLSPPQRAAHRAVLRRTQEQIRAAIQQRDAEVVIPTTRSRKAPIPYDRKAYRSRDLVERLWCRLKDWRRIATRYDKLAITFMAGVVIEAAITFWCDCVPNLSRAKAGQYNRKRGLTKPAPGFYIAASDGAALSGVRSVLGRGSSAG